VELELELRLFVSHPRNGCPPYLTGTGGQRRRCRWRGGRCLLTGFC